MDCNIDYRECSRCKRVGTDTSFYPSCYQSNKPGNKTGICRDCKSYENKKHYRENKAAIWKYDHKRNRTQNRKDSMRASYLKRKFGISLETFRQMEKAQDYRCAICGDHSESRSLAVDHNHETKQIRELLCTKCNNALGACREDVYILEKMIAYIRRHNQGEQNYV